MKRKRWARSLGLGVILLSMLGVSGCDLFPHRNVPERRPEGKPEVRQSTVPLTSYRFDDIPIPPGMTLNRKESFIYETGEIKTGLLVYEGNGEMEKLAGFFKEQMPKYRWRLMSNFELHNIMLSFIKEGWGSVIYILPTESETKRIEIRTGPIGIKVS
jgi:hypothetical protein